MMKVQILGTGCPKCKKLAELTDQAAKELGLELEIGERKLSAVAVRNRHGRRRARLPVGAASARPSAA